MVVVPLTWRRWTFQCSVDGLKEVIVAAHEKGKMSAAQQILEVLEVVVGRIRVGRELGGLVAGAKREVAYFDLQEFHDLSKNYSDASNVLVLPSAVHLARSLSADCNMVDRKVFVDVLGMKVQLQEDARTVEMVLDSRKEGKGFGRTAKQYSARRDAGRVVLGP